MWVETCWSSKRVRVNMLHRGHSPKPAAWTTRFLQLVLHHQHAYSCGGPCVTQGPQQVAAEDKQGYSFMIGHQTVNSMTSTCNI